MIKLRRVIPAGGFPEGFDERRFDIYVNPDNVLWVNPYDTSDKPLSSLRMMDGFDLIVEGDIERVKNLLLGHQFKKDDPDLSQEIKYA